MRGVEGKIAAARYAREKQVPCLGICLGLQAMTSSSTPATCVGLTDANSTEFDMFTEHPVIDFMPDQRELEDKGGTMRLGAWMAKLTPGSKVATAYGEQVVSERHRHRYEFNDRSTAAQLEEARAWCSAARPTSAWSSSSSCPTTRSSSARRRTPSSRAGPTARTRCSASLIGAALERRARPTSDEPHARGAGRALGPAVAALSAVSRLGVTPPASATSGESEVHQGYVWHVATAEFDGARRIDVPARHRALTGRRRRSCRWCSTPKAMPSVVLVTQYRPPYERIVIEIPAGMRDVQGRTPPVSRA